MRVILLSLFLILSALSARADEDAIQSVIQSQITAFKQDDFETAFTYASPGIRQFFGTSERFGAMVRNGYPMVWRPADIEFLPLKSDQQGIFQDVIVTDQDGTVHVLRYSMTRTENGWQIDGVRVLRAPSVGV